MLIYEIGELEDQFVDRYDQYRVTIKSIRNIEASVQPSRDSTCILYAYKKSQANQRNHRKAKDYR